MSSTLVSRVGARIGSGAGYRKLAYATVGMMFLLIIVGGIVRVSDSGLGCGPGGSGTEGWPLCGGRVVPLIDTQMIVEYSHRILATIVTVMVALPGAVRVAQPASTTGRWCAPASARWA